MCSRHSELNGADSEYVDPRDTHCDYCARFSRPLHQVTLNNSISWLCDTCYQRQQDERLADQVAAYIVASAYVEALTSNE